MTAYNHIRSNKRRSVLLIVLFSVLVVGLGWFLGFQFDAPRFGVIVATLIATTMTLVGYFRGDRVALAIAGAKPISKSDAPTLFRLVENLTITAGLPMPDVYIIPDDAPNAFATGRSPEHAAIAVTAGLLRILDKTELEGVLAHELSHVKNYDVRVMTLVVVLVGAVMLLSDFLLRSFIFRDNDRPGGQIGLILMLVGIVLAILSPFIAQLIKLAVSRSREYMADASGVLLTRYPEGLAGALEKIAEHDKPLRRANHATAHMFLANPFDPHVRKRFERLFSTHPPIENRIARIQAMAT